MVFLVGVWRIIFLDNKVVRFFLFLFKDKKVDKLVGRGIFLFFIIFFIGCLFFVLWVWVFDFIDRFL